MLNNIDTWFVEVSEGFGLHLGVGKLLQLHQQGQTRRPQLKQYGVKIQMSQESWKWADFKMSASDTVLKSRLSQCVSACDYSELLLQICESYYTESC